MGYRNYSVANGLIVDKLGNGDFTTISAALAVAQSGQTIFVRPGTYIENPTLVAGVDVVAYVTDSDIPNVIIQGTVTCSSVGTFAISGIQLETNNGFALLMSGNQNSTLYVNDCFINCLNNTGINFTNASSLATLNLFDCAGNLGATGIGIYTMSSPGNLELGYCNFTNSAGSSAASTNSAGLVTLSWSGFFSPISTSGTGLIITQWGFINTIAQNTTALTLSGTGTNNGALGTSFGSGSASAISIGSSNILNVTQPINVNSSNTNAITGAGTIQFTLIGYNGTSSKNNVTTQTPFITQPGTWKLLQTLTASSSASLEFKNLPTQFTQFAFTINNLRIATNAQAVQFVASSNNGVSYANSGYLNGINYTSYNSATVTNVNSTTFAVVTSNAANSAGISGLIFVDLGDGSYYGTVKYQSTDSAVNAFGTCGGGTGVGNFNAFKFQSSSGNLTSGSISIYGIST
jgi:hypothetical protein